MATRSTCGRPGREHHVVTLRERPRAALLGVHFSAPDRAAVDALHANAKVFGAEGGRAAAVRSNERRRRIRVPGHARRKVMRS